MGHDFHVRLDGITLSAAEEQDLNRALQSTVLAQLAKVDKKGDFAAVLRPDDGETNGIIAVPLPVEPNSELSARLEKARHGFGG